MSKEPILLFGLPRSGTTWLGKIFDSHPATFYRHEPDSLKRFGTVPLIVDAGDAAAWRDQVGPYVEQIATMRSAKLWKYPLFPKHYCRGSRFALLRASVFAGKSMVKVFGDFPVPNFVRADQRGDIRLVWKSIESVGRLGLIVRTLPAVRVILILRHPCGFVASILRGEAAGKFGRGWALSHDLTIMEKLTACEQARRRGITVERMQAMEPIERLAWHWALSNEKAMEEIEGRDDCMVLRYEDVCAHPVEESRRLFAFAGLAWDAQTEEFLARSTASEQHDYYSVFKNPLVAANKWRNQLSVQQVEQVLSIARQSVPGRLYDSWKFDEASKTVPSARPLQVSR